MTHRPEWILALSREHVLQVAHALGLETQRAKGGASGGSFACPSCAASNRHPSRHDKRLACGVVGTGSGFRCFECDVSGDQLHLVALTKEGKLYGALDGDAKARVRAWVEDWTGNGASPVRPRLEIVLGDASPAYPDPGEVEALLDRGKAVASDERCSRWLAEDRALRPTAIDAAALAVVLPFKTECPAWAHTGSAKRVGKPWSETGYRLLVPMLDANGRARNVLARYVGVQKSKDAPKSRAAVGFNRKGLVLANAHAAAILRGEPSHPRLVIAEGEMDLLAFSTTLPDAVLGIVSGSWTPEIASRIPDRTQVTIATHLDTEGEKYAAKIVESLAPRIATGALRVRRWRSPS